MEIKVFNNPVFGDIRVLKDENNEPWFVAKDVAEILGYKRPADAVRQLVDDEDKGVGKIPTPGGMQEMVIINESGLYSLILNSKLPQAKKFKRWVTSEVLPAIRRHGLYATPDTIDKIIANPDFGIKLLTKLKEEQQRRIKAEKQLIENLPRIAYAKQVEKSENSIDIGTFAKMLNKRGVSIGRNRLFKWLKDNGYLMQSTAPYQKYIELGYFETIPAPKQMRDGSIRVFPKTLITPKGQIYFAEKLIKEFKVEKV